MDDFWIDEQKVHDDLFQRCLDIMSKHLKKDICNLQLPGSLVGEVESHVIKSSIPLELQYACRFWVSHLQRAGNKLLHENDRIHLFFQEHLLHWIEVLNLLGKVSEGLLMLGILESMSLVSVSALILSNTHT